MRLQPRANVLFAALTSALVILFGASEALAFCRTTTCDQKREHCPIDARECLMTGIPLYWPDTCVTFGTHVDGSPLRKISFARANEVAERAFQSWISADCGAGRRPSIGVVPRGEIFCDQVEFNHQNDELGTVAAPNANLIVFRDNEWPYEDARRTIALTTITYAVPTGEILDADIEVNSANMELSTGDVNVTSDLQSVLTHEVGHLFGLAHSIEPTATLNKNYDHGDLSFRSLSKDDAAGICAIYPPGETDVVDCRGEGPRYGFSRHCGNPVQADAGIFCSIPVGKANHSGWAALILAAGVAGLVQLVRRPRRTLS